MPHLITPPESSDSFFPGGLFLHSHTLPSSFASYLSPPSSSDPITASCFCWKRSLRVEGGIGGGALLSLSLSLNGTSADQKYGRESGEILGHRDKKVEGDNGVREEKEKVEINGSGALNMTKHLWAGAVAAMVSRSSKSFLLFLHYHSTHTHVTSLLLNFTVSCTFALKFPYVCQLHLFFQEFDRDALLV